MKARRRIIIVTGSPCVGKTSVSLSLASKLNAVRIDLAELALRENLITGKDEERGSMVIDEDRVKLRVREIIEGCGQADVVVDGHYAVNVVPKELVTHVFVLRRDPVELRKLMEERGFSGRKLWENLASEILDVCLFEAVNAYGKGGVCEVDVSGKSVEEAVDEIVGILNGFRACSVGVVDWLGKLENEGLLDEYLRI